MAFVMKVEIQSDGDVVGGCSVELGCDDGLAGDAAPGEIGLRLADAKRLLAHVQSELVSAQVRRIVQRTATCRACGAKLQTKDYRSRHLDTLFGRVTLRVPRRRCASCETGATIDAAFTAKATPELIATQAKLAAHLPYRVAGRLLGDLMPVDGGKSHTTIRTRTMAVGRSLSYRQADEAVVAPASTATVTLDGAFIRAVPATGVRHMQVTVGSVERPNKRRVIFAAVGAAGISVTGAVRAHLFGLGVTAERATVLTDGEDGLHNLVAGHTSSPPLPVLDWFHLAMRLQHVKQAACGLSTLVPSHARATSDIQRELERLHWRLWHGTKRAVQTSVDRLASAIRAYKSHHRGRCDGWVAARKVWSLLLELRRYTNGQRSRLVNYAARYRAGQRVSTSVVESTVNSLVNRRMNKRQQMRWSATGAHHLLQVRAADLNGTLQLGALRKPEPTTTANDNIASRAAA